MIDGIKIYIGGKSANIIFKHHVLNFSAKVNTVTGEIITIISTNKNKTVESKTIVHEAIYEHLTFTYKETTTRNKQTNIMESTHNLEINGSLHKYYTNGFNNTDYTYFDFVCTIYKLSKTFGINPFHCRITNLEFGVNINPKENIYHIISQCIFLKNKMPNVNNYNGKGYMKVFEFAQYSVKMYDKGIQYGSDNNQLRFEIKAKKNQYLKFANIITLADLFDIEKWNKLSNHLQEMLMRLLIYEDIDLNLMPHKDQLFYTKTMNSNYWYETHQKSKHTLKEHRQKFKKLTNDYGNNLQKNLLYQIKEKTKILINSDCNIQDEIEKLVSIWKNLPPVFTNTNLFSNFSLFTDSISKQPPPTIITI